MLYLVLCRDRPGAEDLRKQTREAHLDYVGASGDRVKIGGPMLSDDGATMIGSLLVIEAESLSDAQAWSALDPYARADLFEKVEIRPWKWLIGNPED